MRPRAEGWVASVRRFVAATPAHTPRCDLCAAALPETHPHLFDRDDRRLICACRACALLMPASNLRLARVPEETSRLAGVEIDDRRWAEIGIPVGIAFFVKASPSGRVRAMYPGAAGVTESL